MTNIPFGNSEFQIKNFIANEYTPERAVRKIYLQLDKKQRALDEYKFKQRGCNIDKKEIQQKLKKLSRFKKFERERLELEFEQIEYNERMTQKLVDDCITEINIYYELLEKLPKFNREQFELSEELYWRTRLLNDARREIMNTGRVQKDTLDSLEKVNLWPVKDEQGMVAFKIKTKDGYIDYKPKQMDLLPWLKEDTKTSF